MWHCGVVGWMVGINAGWMEDLGIGGVVLGTYNNVDDG